MTARDRVLAAFEFENVAPVPYTLWYDHDTREKLNRHYGSDAWERRIENHILRLTVDWEPRRYLDDTRFVDLLGSVWEEGNPVHLTQPVLRDPTLAGFELPPFGPLVRTCTAKAHGGPHAILPMLTFEEARRLLNEQRGRVYTVVGYGFGLFECAWSARGYENFFADLLINPDFAHELLDLLLTKQLEVIDALVELPCDGIILSDDYGDQRGVIIGPDLWRTFIKPRLARLYQRIHAAGKTTLQHTCGNVFDIIPDLIEIGLDVLQSLQPEAMPVYEVKRRYGDVLRLWGGLGTQQLLPFGTVEDVRHEVRRLKTQLGAGGGYVFTSSKPIMSEVPIENAVALLEETLNSDPK